MYSVAEDCGLTLSHTILKVSLDILRLLCHQSLPCAPRTTSSYHCLLLCFIHILWVVLVILMPLYTRKSNISLLLLLLLHMIDAHNIMFKLLYLPYDISCLNKPVQSSSLPLFLHDCSSLLIYHILLNSVEVIQKNNNIKSQYRSISELYKICHRSRYI